jgi:anti-sigma B factor antagonist
MATAYALTEVRRLQVSCARLDTTAARSLLRDAEDAFAGGARALVIDLSRVTFIDSLGVAALAQIVRRAPSGSRIALAALTPYAQTIARVTHLHEVFDIYATVEAAVTALSY